MLACAMNPCPSLGLNPNVKVLAICNANESVAPNKKTTFAHLNPQPNFQVVADDKVWNTHVYKRIIPLNTINFIANWADRTYR